MWDAPLGAILIDLDWTRMVVHPGVWLHKKTGAVMAVYVDDLLQAAGKHDEARLWKEIKRHVKFGEPVAPTYLDVSWWSSRGLDRGGCVDSRYADEGLPVGCRGEVPH